MSIPDFKLDIKIEPDLYDLTARKIAESFITKKIVFDKKTNETHTEIKGVSRHQLRRIFDEVKSINRKFGTYNNDTWKKEALPLVKMIKAKTAYLVARMKDKNRNNQKVMKCYDSLQEFIQKAINQINEKKTFEIFTSFFEAIYGYYYETGGIETN